MISPDLSIGEDPFLIMLTPSVAILCFARIRANPKINLPDSAARMVISVELDGPWLAAPDGAAARR